MVIAFLGLLSKEYFNSTHLAPHNYVLFNFVMNGEFCSIIQIIWHLIQASGSILSNGESYELHKQTPRWWKCEINSFQYNYKIMNSHRFFLYTSIRRKWYNTVVRINLGSINAKSETYRNLLQICHGNCIKGNSYLGFES